MTSRIGSYTIDCIAWEPLVAFWSAALDFADDPDDPNSPGDPMGMIVSSDKTHHLLFIPVPEDKVVKNRVHLDIEPTDRTRDEEVERLTGLGATVVDDRRNVDGSGWVVMGDPEGNEFCVERSTAERAATRAAAADSGAEQG
jgi:predicted enzyme related to lactoylglutathione lyase